MEIVVSDRALEDQGALPVDLLNLFTRFAGRQKSFAGSTSTSSKDMEDSICSSDMVPFYLPKDDEKNKLHKDSGISNKYCTCNSANNGMF